MNKFILTVSHYNTSTICPLICYFFQEEILRLIKFAEQTPGSSSGFFIFKIKVCFHIQFMLNRCLLIYAGNAVQDVETGNSDYSQVTSLHLLINSFLFFAACFNP